MPYQQCIHLGFAALMLTGHGSWAQAPDTSANREIAHYDFGRLAGPWTFAGFPIASLDVSAVPWLDNSTMQIRFESDDPWRRRSHAESQWVAPPAALLERFLTRRILFRQQDPLGRGCHLSFRLHELGQSFEKPDSAFVTLEMLATLSAAAGRRTIAKRAFLIQKPSPTPDAVGSVAATRDAVQTLSSEVDLWLTEVAGNSPNLARYCQRLGRLQALK